MFFAMPLLCSVSISISFTLARLQVQIQGVSQISPVGGSSLKQQEASDFMTWSPFSCSQFSGPQTTATTTAECDRPSHLSVKQTRLQTHTLKLQFVLNETKFSFNFHEKRRRARQSRAESAGNWLCIWREKLLDFPFTSVQSEFYHSSV